MIVKTSFLPPPPTPEDWVVTVWVREKGIVVAKRVETCAEDEDCAKWGAIRHLGLNFKDDFARVVDIRVRKRWQTGGR